MLGGKLPSFLVFELFHTFVRCPGSLEVGLAWVSKLLSLRLNLPSTSLLRHRSHSVLSPHLSDEEARSNTGAVGRIHSEARVIKADTLVVEARDVKLGVLDEASQMVRLPVV